MRKKAIERFYDIDQGSALVFIKHHRKRFKRIKQTTNNEDGN